MAPKNANSKKEQGRAKKAENETNRSAAAAAQAEKREEDAWTQGAKSNKAKEEKEEKRKAELAKKAEIARLLAEEELSVSAAKPKANKGGKKKAPPVAAGPGAIAANAVASPSSKDKEELREEPEEFAATGIDDALDLLNVVTQKMDKASLGQAASGIEKHPERRFKAAFEAYQERELPNLKVEHPGLRLQQYKELLYKQFQKSPENPFNQATIAYDASKEEKLDVLRKEKESTESRLRQ